MDGDTQKKIELQVLYKQVCHLERLQRVQYNTNLLAQKDLWDKLEKLRKESKELQNNLDKACYIHQQYKETIGD